LRGAELPQRAGKAVREKHDVFRYRLFPQQRKDISFEFDRHSRDGPNDSEILIVQQGLQRLLMYHQIAHFTQNSNKKKNFLAMERRWQEEISILTQLLEEEIAKKSPSEVEKEIKEVEQELERLVHGPLDMCKPFGGFYNLSDREDVHLMVSGLVDGVKRLEFLKDYREYKNKRFLIPSSHTTLDRGSMKIWYERVWVKHFWANGNACFRVLDRQKRVLCPGEVSVKPLASVFASKQSALYYKRYLKSRFPDTGPFMCNHRGKYQQYHDCFQ
jgi:hypothetical protein